MADIEKNTNTKTDSFLPYPDFIRTGVCPITVEFDDVGMFKFDQVIENFLHFFLKANGGYQRV